MQSLKRDGVRLSFDIVDGSEGLPIVLVHGWCCDHSYFAPQFEHFAKRGHRVVAVDLRGHGASDKPQQQYTMRGFADDVAWLCGELSFSKCAVIGHSMGGIIAFDLAVRHPELVAAVVMIDAAVVVPAERRLRVASLVEALSGPNYRAVLSDYIASALMLPTDERARKDSIVAQMTAAPHHVMISAFEVLRDYDPTVNGRRLSVPALFIAADEPQPRCDMVRLQELLSSDAKCNTPAD